MKRELRRGCADLSDGLTFFVAVVLAICLFAFCYGYWYDSPQQKDRRAKMNEYERKYHYHEGRWK